MSPQCRTNRSTAAGNFFLAVVSVMTEISDGNGQMSSHDFRRLENMIYSGLS
jgi:hypothetical protein